MSFKLFDTKAGRSFGPVRSESAAQDLPAHVRELRVIPAPPPALAPGQLRRRTETADLEAGVLRLGWRVEQLPVQPVPEPDERDVILEALKADLTPAKLAAARQRLKARRQGP